MTGRTLLRRKMPDAQVGSPTESAPTVDARSQPEMAERTGGVTQAATMPSSGGPSQAGWAESPLSGVAVQVRGVSHAFPAADGQATTVLQAIDLDVADGEFVAIVGPSGCGKTTLLNLVAGLEPVQRGTVLVRGHPPRCGDRDVGYLFARDALLPWRSVLGNAELALEIAGVARHERTDQARQLLADVGLAAVADAYPAQLSQGMRQRVAIARTLAASPSLLMLDEPFSALDAQTKLLLQDAFSALWQQLRSTVVLITHDLSEAVALADRVVLMTAAPGRVKRVFPIDLDRPRSVVSLQGDPAYHRIYQELWGELCEEVTR